MIDSKVVEKYAFKASDYPVILSLENHCCVSQQTEMARIFKKEFGGRCQVLTLVLLFVVDLLDT